MRILERAAPAKKSGSLLHLGAYKWPHLAVLVTIVFATLWYIAYQNDLAEEPHPMGSQGFIAILLFFFFVTFCMFFVGAIKFLFATNAKKEETCRRIAVVGGVMTLVISYLIYEELRHPTGVQTTYQYLLPDGSTSSQPPAAPKIDYN